jgi:hypothetical protein
MKFNQLIYGPYIGVGSPVNQTWWIDDLTVMDGLPVAGINQQAESGDAICIYPNPSAGKLRMEFEGLGVARLLEIYNLSGERICSANLSQQTTIDIDLSLFPKGFYFARIYAGGEIFSRKFVLE